MIIENNQIKKEQYEKIKELLIVIDMVKGFVEEGKMAAPSIKRIVPFEQELLDRIEKSTDAANVFVKDSHTKDSIEFKTYNEHCIIGTGEEDIIDELKHWHDNGIIIKKNNTNFMLAPTTIPMLEKMVNLKKVGFVGCLTDICVKNGAITARNYFDEYNRDVEVGIYTDGIDTYEAPNHNIDEFTKRAIEDMETNGVKVYRKEMKER